MNKGRKFLRYSHSRVETFERCKLAFQFKYIFGIELIKNLDADNPLLLGSGMHHAIEGNNDYLEQFPIIKDTHINEEIKIDLQSKRVRTALNGYDCEFEVELKTDEFLGYIDLVQYDGDEVNLYDFKYSNNEDYYLQSRQLHIYKYYYEKLYNKKVNKLGYIFIPKTFIRQKNKEDLFNFRKRIVETIERPYIKYVDYDHNKVVEFFKIIKKIENTNFNGMFTYCKNKYCDYCRNLEKGENYMFELPKNEKRERVIDTKPDLWIYADSYVGKSTFVDKFEDLLFINTDGNIDNTESPFVLIRNEKKQEGRLIKTKFGWESFLEVIDSLETQENTFKTIAIDLVEDLRDLCRLYIFDKYNWEHESDGGFGKGWQMVSSEFNTAMKRLKSLGYQIVYISKEKREEVKLRNGNTRTIFTPNIDDKTANVLSGTVDLTVRAFIDEEGKRKLQLKKINNAFGGGRFNFKRDVIDLDMNEFKEALIEAQDGVKSKEEVKETTPPDTSIPDTVEEAVEEKPKRRRKVKTVEVMKDEDGNEIVNPFTEEVELEKTETKRRRRGE